MYPKLPINITKRYIFIIHQCLVNLNSFEKKIVKESGNIEISKIFSDPSFNIFISYIENLFNHNQLKPCHARLIFLFLGNNKVEQNKKDKFYLFYKQNKTNLITSPVFLKYFLEKDFKYKIFNEKTAINYKKLNSSLDIIKNSLPKGLNKIIQKKARYINLRNDYGCINSLTIYKCYDLIFLSLNNPVFLIIEQIIHEHTHIKFGKLIESKKYEHFFDKSYSVFSPFANKVRPVEYLANGYFSFIAVLNLYNYYLINYDSIKTVFEIPDRLTLKKRISSLKSRIKNAELIINGIFLNNSNWKNFKSEFSLDFNLDMPTKTQHFKLNKEFTNIQNAEIYLGLNTNKISRITIPISKTSLLAQTVPINNFLFSNDAFVNSDTEDLESFNNLYNNIGSHINSKNDQNTFVNCYIGKNLKQIKKAVENDQFDTAGDFFKIPNCCQEYFNKNWLEIVKKYKGDCVKYALKSIENNKQFKWQTNALAMYFDAGYTWHFPCTLNCSKTIKLSNERYQALKEINPKLANKLKENAKGEFRILNDNNYARIGKNKSAFTSISNQGIILKSINFY